MPRKSRTEETEAWPLGPTFRKEVGQRIKVLVDGFSTRKKAAVSSGVSTDQLLRYISGESKPTFEFIVRLANANDVSLDWLIHGNLPVHTPERLDAFIEATGGEAARQAQQTVPVIGMAACGIQGWFNRDPLTVRAAWPGGAPPDAFGVMAVGLSLRPAGIEPGFLGLRAPTASLDIGDKVFIERADGHVSLKRFDGPGSKGKDWLQFSGWLDPDSAGRQAPYTDETARAYIKRLAPVVYIKCKL